ncbi:unnamed protein product [Polarella glacialis]|uniref:J domain-containing protein n=1 Tax=Polarella glacialis TaxID=89957 RepID=A0A813IFM8_POLGL|nr:unnamed protein product [Polarella glacialis]
MFDFDELDQADSNGLEAAKVQPVTTSTEPTAETSRAAGAVDASSWKPLAQQQKQRQPQHTPPTTERTPPPPEIRAALSSKFDRASLVFEASESSAPASAASAGSKALPVYSDLHSVQTKPSTFRAPGSPGVFGIFKVVERFVFVRRAPFVKANKIAEVSKGVQVSGTVREGWLHLDPVSLSAAEVPTAEADGYMLIDGRSVGLGVLLERLPSSENIAGLQVFTGPLDFVATSSLSTVSQPTDELDDKGSGFDLTIGDFGQTAPTSNNNSNDNNSKNYGRSQASAGSRMVAEGALISGYPGPRGWLEMVDGTGFLPIASTRLTGALQAEVRQIFAEAVAVEWASLPVSHVAHVAYCLEWEDLGHDGPRLRGRLSGLQGCMAHVRGLPPETALRLRVTACVRARASEPHVVGRWLYGSKPSEYFIEQKCDGTLVFTGPHARGTVTGVLAVQDQWFQAELISNQGDVVGGIRLFFDEREQAVISNFRGTSKTEWGKDIIAKKGDAQIHADLFGEWCQVSTDKHVTKEEEQELCFDPLSNRRGKCLKCACPGFILTQHILNQALESVLCRRCGCPVSSHAKTGKFEYAPKSAPRPRAEAEFRGNRSEEPHSEQFGPGQARSAWVKDAIGRPWSPDEAPSNMDPVEFVIEQLEKAQNLFEVLGVTSHASSLEIRQAFRAISLRIHPDKMLAKRREEGPEATEVALKAEEAFKLLASAYQVLSEERARRDYEREMRLELAKVQKPLAQRQPRRPQPPRETRMPDTRHQKSSQGPATRHDEWPAGSSEGTQGEACEFFKNPSIRSFMSSPYYGQEGVFGQCGAVTETLGGGFSFVLPGGGGIHVGGSHDGFRQGQQLQAGPVPTGPLLSAQEAVWASQLGQK